MSFWYPPHPLQRPTASPEKAAVRNYLDPGKIYRFELDLWSTAQTFLPGHRVRMQVTSSNFLRCDRNLNTGGHFGEEVRGEVAINALFHDTLRPSHVMPPILPHHH